MMAAYSGIFLVTTSALSSAQNAQKPSLLAVACEAASLRAKILHQQLSSSGSKLEDAGKGLDSIANQMLQLLKQNGSNYSAVKATAEIVGWAKLAGKELPVSALEVGVCKP